MTDGPQNTEASPAIEPRFEALTRRIDQWIEKNHIEDKARENGGQLMLKQDAMKAITMSFFNTGTGYKLFFYPIERLPVHAQKREVFLFQKGEYQGSNNMAGYYEAQYRTVRHGGSLPVIMLSEPIDPNSGRVTEFGTYPQSSPDPEINKNLDWSETVQVDPFPKFDKLFDELEKTPVPAQPRR